MNKVDVYESVTNKIIAQLEQGVIPWKRPYALSGGYPVSLSTGKHYRGINVLLLMLENYDDPRWGTYRMIKELGGQVRKGEHGTGIVFWKRVKREHPKEDQDQLYWLLRGFTVFNATQADGLPALPEKEEREFTPIEQAERLVADYVWTPGSENPGPPVEYGFNHAAYDLRKDRLELPDPQQFYTDEGYYCTLFHELVHSTGHEKRLKRIEPALFGSDPYAKEELVAEVGASFLAGLAGFESAGGEQSAAYLDNWLSVLRQDKKLVVSASAQAQKAVDLITKTTFEERDKEDEGAKHLVAA